MQERLQARLYQDMRLTAPALAVGLALAEFANNATMKSWPSQSTLASMTRLNARTVRRALKLLVLVGVIVKLRHYTGPPGYSRCTYTFTASWYGPVEAESGTDQTDRESVSKRTESPKNKRREQGVGGARQRIAAAPAVGVRGSEPVRAASRAAPASVPAAATPRATQTGPAAPALVVAEEHRRVEVQRRTDWAAHNRSLVSCGISVEVQRAMARHQQRQQHVDPPAENRVPVPSDTHRPEQGEGGKPDPTPKGGMVDALEEAFTGPAVFDPGAAFLPGTPKHSRAA